MTPGPADVVRTFYAALADRDAERLGVLIEESFADDVVLAMPPSLAPRGDLVGAHRLRRTFTAMLTAVVPVGPTEVAVTDLVDGGDRVAAVLTFAWWAPHATEPIPMSAVEMWTFADGRVAEVRAFYRDTAACVAAVAAPAVPPSAERS